MHMEVLNFTHPDYVIKKRAKPVIVGGSCDGINPPSRCWECRGIWRHWGVRVYCKGGHCSI
jgi:hypothetical protein